MYEQILFKPYPSATAPHEGVQVDDLPHHSAYYSYAHEQKKNPTN